MSEEVTYELATARWRRTSTVQIISLFDSEIADFPLSFLASCGVNSWQYILDVVDELVDPVPGHPGGIFIVNDGEDEESEVQVALGEMPSAGIYRFKQLGVLTISLD